MNYYQLTILVGRDWLFMELQASCQTECRFKEFEQQKQQQKYNCLLKPWKQVLNTTTNK